MTNLTLFQAQAPGIIRKAQLYDPTINPTGTVVPALGSLIIDTDNNGLLYWVEAVDPVTYASTLSPAQMLVNVTPEDTSLTSVVSYGNVTFRVYCDSRTTPYSLAIDSLLVIYGTDNATYQLTRFPGTSNETIISLYYNANGSFMGNRVPLAAVDSVNPQSSYYCTNCNTSVVLNDDEKLRLDVFNSHGAQTASVDCFVKLATIINEGTGVEPIITGLTIGSTQLRSNNEIYIYETQDPSSLNITAKLTYSDGTMRDVDIDNQRCFVYGLEDFVASYLGLQQTIVVKYFLTDTQSISDALLLQSGTHITATANLVVVSNNLAPGVKLSVIPRWTSSLNAYSLFYYLYSVDRNVVENVTAHVTIASGTFTGNSYGTFQDFTVSIDLYQIDPNTYGSPSVYQQEVLIKLQPLSLYERYVLRDSSNSVNIYGPDNPTKRRPVLEYDSTHQQYFIPSGFFVSSDSFLQSFYYSASPPYDTSQTTTPPVPTHFVLRDSSAGTTLTATQIPLSQYAQAFSVIGDTTGNLVGNNVIVEFLQISGGTTLILLGVPVDVYLSSTGYIGS